MNSMTTFGWLVKREYWESRRGFLWAPFWAAAAIIIITILGIIAGEVLKARLGGDHVYMGGISFGQMLGHASPEDLAQMGKALSMTMFAFAGIVGMVLSFVIFFYLLGALYDDRKDRSILFWKSLPLSDTGTVLSKVVSAVILAPLIAIAVVLCGYVAMQVLVSLWLIGHGINPIPLLWLHADPFALWFRMLLTIPVSAIWALPTAGWLLFWSAAVRSKPFLWAIIIPLVAGLLNFWVGLLQLPHIRESFYWGQLFFRALFSVVPVSWAWPEGEGAGLIHHGDLATEGLLSYQAMGHALATPDMWIGAAVGVAMIAAAIWFRRWRDEA